MADVKIDMEKVTTETVRQLGGQLALLTLELNAQRAANEAAGNRIAELEKATQEAKQLQQRLAERDAEIARLRDQGDDGMAGVPARV